MDGDDVGKFNLMPGGVGNKCNCMGACFDKKCPPI